MLYFCLATLAACTGDPATAPNTPNQAANQAANQAESPNTTTVTSTPTATPPPATPDDPFGDEMQTTGVIGVLHSAP